MVTPPWRVNYRLVLQEMSAHRSLQARWHEGRAPQLWPITPPLLVVFRQKILLQTASLRIAEKLHPSFCSLGQWLQLEPIAHAA